MANLEQYESVILCAHNGSEHDMLIAEYYEPATSALLLHFKFKEVDHMFGMEKSEAFRLLEFLVMNLCPELERDPDRTPLL